MDDHELKALIKKPAPNTPLKKGDRVRIIEGISSGDKPGTNIYYATEMIRMQGSTFTVGITGEDRVYYNGWTWHESWLERV